jgi:pilus assembly protein FimV
VEREGTLTVAVGVESLEMEIVPFADLDKLGRAETDEDPLGDREALEEREAVTDSDVEPDDEGLREGLAVSVPLDVGVVEADAERDPDGDVDTFAEGVERLDTEGEPETELDKLALFEDDDEAFELIDAIDADDDCDGCDEKEMDTRLLSDSVGRAETEFDRLGRVEALTFALCEAELEANDERDTDADGNPLLEAFLDKEGADEIEADLDVSGDSEEVVDAECELETDGDEDSEPGRTETVCVGVESFDSLADLEGEGLLDARVLTDGDTEGERDIELDAVTETEARGDLDGDRDILGDALVE